MRDETRALEVAGIAYDKDLPKDNVIYIKHKNEQCCIIISDDKVEIGGAGSNDFKDWFQNTLILGINVPGLGRVPRGFYKNIDLLVDKIIFYLQNHKDKQIDLSGHSRGVPIVGFIAYRLWERGFNVRSLIGFGCPNFVKELGAEQIRGVIPDVRIYKNGADQVTRHPNFGYIKPVKQINMGPKRNLFTYFFNKDHIFDRYGESLKNV